MNENIRTGIFGGVAVFSVAVVLLVTWIKSPSAATDPGEAEGALVSESYNPLDVTSLEIVKYNASLNRADVFKVAKVDGAWVIPSHHNYPTDSENNPLASIAGSIRGLKQLGVVSDSRTDHSQYEVIEPDPSKNQAGEKGVGTRVTLLAGAKPVVNLIIGKSVKDKPQLRYVREPGRDRVYEAKISTDQFSTKFEDWINADLLRVNSWDVKKLVVKDYSVDITKQELNPKGEYELIYDDAATGKKWTLHEITPPAASEEQPETPLGDALNEQKLNDSVAELSKVKAVDVQPKPKGFGAQATLADGLQVSQGDIEALAMRGFYAVAADRRSRAIQIVSQQGEREIVCKDGVVYTLRFGAVTAVSGGGADAPKTNNRYLLITVRFDESVFPQPELKPLPGEETEWTAYTVRELQELRDQGLMVEADIKAKRAAVEAENKRLLDDWESRAKPGREKVEKLSRRFGDWYYVISDDVFNKIHFSRDDIRKKPGDPDPMPEPATPGLPPGLNLPGFPPGGNSPDESP